MRRSGVHGVGLMCDRYASRFPGDTAGTELCRVLRLLQVETHFCMYVDTPVRWGFCHYLAKRRSGNVASAMHMDVDNVTQTVCTCL